MQEFDEQLKYWDSESDTEAYCEKQLMHLRKTAVCEMIDTAYDKIDFEPKRILEIGGGSQLVSRHLADKLPHAQFICTDISEARVNQFNQYYDHLPPNMTVQGGIDARSLPFDDQRFDLIVGDAMLHHIDFLKPALLEINRCLAPKGYAIFVREPIIGLLGVLTYRFLQLTGKDKKHIDLNHFEYKRMLTQWQYEFMMAGFISKKIKHWPNQGLVWKIRALFPHLTPCYLGFILKKNNSA